MYPPLFAAIEGSGTNWLEIVKPLAVCGAIIGVFVVLPIVALLLEHQRKMARLLHGVPDEALRQDVKQLRAELREALGDKIQLSTLECGDSEDDESGVKMGLIVGSSKHVKIKGL